MFTIFKTEPREVRLQKQFYKLISDWHRLSAINRTRSLKKYRCAQRILDQLNKLRQHQF